MADGPEVVSPVPATGGSPGTSRLGSGSGRSSGTNGLGSGSAAAIESVLRGRLQGPGRSGAPGIAYFAASLPTAHGIAVVLTFLQDPEEGLPVGSVAAALNEAFGMPAKAAVTGVLAAAAPSPLHSDTATEALRRPAANGGLGASASSEAGSEEEARCAYQHQHAGLGLSIDPKFLCHILATDARVAVAEMKDIGAHQKWPALHVGGARALADAVKEAWGSGDYAKLSLPDRNALDAAKAISGFYD